MHSLKPERSPSRTQASAKTSLSRQCRILIADDDNDSRELLAIFFGMEGHDVLKASDGAEALRLAASFRPDVVCTDIWMPRLTGIELLAQLRRDPITSTVAVFAVTAVPLENRRRLERLGFDRVFPKPIDLGALSASIRAIAACIQRPSVDVSH
jgi:CheY-like chemotaxis protein